MEPKHNYVLFKTSLFGPFIGSWCSFSYMYVALICNVSPTSTFPPWNSHYILTELSKWFECVDLGRNRFGDLEQHGWTPVVGRGELGVTVFFLILPFALLNSSQIKWVWHLRKIQFVIARFSELLIHGNNLFFTIEFIFSKNKGVILFEFMEQVSVTVMKQIIISYIPHYIWKFLKI